MAKGKRKKKRAAEAVAEQTGSGSKRQRQSDGAAGDEAAAASADAGSGAGAAAPAEPAHRVQVLAAEQRFQALLALLNRPSDQELTTVVFGGTKAGCDKLHAALSAQPGSARWALEAVHGGKRRDEQEASLRAFAAGECRCLIATETFAKKLGDSAFADGPDSAAAASVDLLVNYELPEDFFVRPTATHRAFVRRIGRQACVTFLRVDSFGGTDVKAAHSLITHLQAEFPAAPIAPQLAALDPGFEGVSARQARQGLVAGASVSHPLEPLTPDSAVLSTGSNAPPLVFCFVISGRPTDRADGAAHSSSWVPFDQSFRSRRDALSRCLTAALWSRPAVPGASNGHGTAAPAVVYSNREVWLIFEESPVTAVRITADWACCIGASVAPTEHALLSALDEAVRGRRPAAGLYLDPMRYYSVGAAAAALLAQHQTSHSGRNVVLELHDSRDGALPVYGAAPAAADSETAIDSVIVTLGCVEDHLESIAAIVSEGKKAGFETGRVNVGPITEFSSKVVHLIQAHHDAGLLRLALEDLFGKGTGNGGGSETVWREKARAPRKGGGLMGERVAADGRTSAAVCDLHFWVWGAAGVSAASALPSAADNTGSDNPKLSQAARQQAWVLANASLAAVGKSHGAYDRKEGVATCKISLVLADCVVTVKFALGMMNSVLEMMNFALK